MEERLQKLLSACGLASRRMVEQWIEAGRVTVNGTKARLGDKADLDRDRIEVDGRPVRPGRRPAVSDAEQASRVCDHPV